jgi:ATP-dependent RNA helicase DeaD
MKFTNPKKRTLLFSATVPPRIRDLAKTYMDGYQLLTVKNETMTTDLTEQIYFEVHASEKFEALCRIIDVVDDFYGLIFCRTKIDVDTVTNKLIDRSYDAEAIHGDISQSQRERTLGKFRKKRINILVATDVAARGIDVENLTHVINYALPHDAESYIHRIGRTGRAGNEGTAITFITPKEYRKLMFIQRFAGTDIKKAKMPTVEDILKAKKKKIYEDLTKVLEDDIDEMYYNWAKSLLEENKPSAILAALLSYSFEEELNPDIYGNIKDGNSSSRSSGQLDKQGKTRLFVALGKKDNFNPRKLVKLIMTKLDIRSRDIDDVQVMDNFSFITVPFDKANEILKSFTTKHGKALVTRAREKN